MIQKSRGLHLKFDKAEGAIVEHDNFDGKISVAGAKARSPISMENPPSPERATT